MIKTHSLVSAIAVIALACASAAVFAAPASPTTAPITTQPSLDAAVTPTLVTIKMDEVKVDDVLAELSKQSGYSLRPFNQAMWNARGNHQKLSVNYQHQPFWEVLVDFCQKAAIAPYFDGSPGRQMLFMPAAQMGPSVINCPASNGGALLMLMTQLARQNSVTFGKNAGVTNEFEAQMTILFEPKVRASAMSYQPILDEATDELGNSLLLPTTSTPNMNSLNRQMQTNLSIPLAYPAKVGTKIVRLRGKIRLAIAVKTETLDFADLTSPKEQTQQFHNGPQVTLQSVKPMEIAPNAADGTPRQYLVQLTVERGQYDQQKFYDLTNGLNLRVTDSQNRDLQFQGNRETSNNGSEAKMTLMYYRRGPDEGAEEVGEPAKVSWELTTESQEITVPFEFKDLPIP